MIWKTRVTKLTKTKYPLIMAAFWRHGITEFAASFSNAGGFGTITALNYELNDFKSELQKMKELTDKPFGVNLTVGRPRGRTDADAQKEEYLRYIEIAIDAGVEIFTTSSYQAPYIGERVHEAGCYWFPKVPLIRHALLVEKAGADAITLMGMESSGDKNPFQHSTLVNGMPIVPDLRIFGSSDPLAIDNACVDAETNAPGLLLLKSDGTWSIPISPGIEKFKAMNPMVDTTIQLNVAFRNKLGSLEYELIKI